VLDICDRPGVAQPVAIDIKHLNDVVPLAAMIDDEQALVARVIAEQRKSVRMEDEILRQVGGHSLGHRGLAREIQDKDPATYGLASLLAPSIF
jgi:hypothetical protein